MGSTQSHILKNICSTKKLKIMKKLMVGMLVLVLLNNDVMSFCGFYVAKADGMLKNKSSQVIMVRDDDRTVITMSNDFKGDVQDFAMVVPVPSVLKKEDIRVMESGIFQRLNDYSAPRLVEYYDQNPCMSRLEDVKSAAPTGAARNKMSLAEAKMDSEKDYGVKVEAQYTVGEYDIMILGAKESTGLKSWLTDNGYKIPASADEVLDPYIKSNLKFFVVKVNLEEQAKTGVSNLRPIQIRFSSPKFMLPIRLGMANADGDQDMIVYAFTRKGRVETTNYRTVSLPTSRNVPLFVKPNFAGFYSSLFENQWKKENKSITFLEYAWDVSPANYVKCDPCVSTPPDMNDLKDAGVWWINNNQYDDYVNEYDADRKKVYFTRLHVRYNRNSFPQDLSFQVTPNKENYQARYIVTHPAAGDMNCAEGRKYLQELKARRKKEMTELASLTGKNYDYWESVAKADEGATAKEATYQALAMNMRSGVEKKDLGVAGIVLLSLIGVGIVATKKFLV
jgi:hypothetical protein